MDPNHGLQVSQHLVAIMGAVLVGTNLIKRLLDAFAAELSGAWSAAIAALVGAVSTWALLAVDGSLPQDDLYVGITATITAMLAFRFLFQKGKRLGSAAVAAPILLAVLALGPLAACSSPQKATVTIYKSSASARLGLQFALGAIHAGYVDGKITRAQGNQAADIAEKVRDSLALIDEADLAAVRAGVPPPDTSGLLALAVSNLGRLQALVTLWLPRSAPASAGGAQ